MYPPAEIYVLHVHIPIDENSISRFGVRKHRLPDSGGSAMP